MAPTPLIEFGRQAPAVFYVIGLFSLLTLSVLDFSTSSIQKNVAGDLAFIKDEGNVLAGVIAPWFATFIASEEGKGQARAPKKCRDSGGVPSSQRGCKGESSAPDIQALVAHHTLRPNRFWVLFTRVRTYLDLGNTGHDRLVDRQSHVDDSKLCRSRSEGS